MKTFKEFIEENVGIEEADQSKTVTLSSWFWKLADEKTRKKCWDVSKKNGIPTHPNAQTIHYQKIVESTTKAAIKEKKLDESLRKIGWETK